MRLISFALIAAALSVTASASATTKSEKRVSVKSMASLPPSEFDKPYRGKLTIIRTESEDWTEAIFGKDWANGNFEDGRPRKNWKGVAASSRGETSCWIFLVKDEVLNEKDWSLAL